MAFRGSHWFNTPAITMRTTASKQFTEQPLAFFLTWTTYGSWLPGDDRGWTDGAGHHRASDAHQHRLAQRACRDRPVMLTPQERVLVARVIRQHCLIRAWSVHAVSCRTQHVHVVVTAANVSPGRVRQELKGWASRRLAENRRAAMQRQVRTWWTECGSTRWIRTPEALDAVIAYVMECQDKPRG